MTNTILSILGALGGSVLFVGGIWAIIRAVLKQVTATESNTESLDELKREVHSLKDEVHGLNAEIGGVKMTAGSHDERLRYHGDEIARLRNIINGRKP